MLDCVVGECSGVEVGRRSRGRHSDDDKIPASPHEAHAALHRGHRADGDEDVVGSPAAREREDTGQHVIVMWVESMRGAEAPRHLELCLIELDCDDGRGTGECCGLDAVQPDAAGSDHDHACPGLDPRCLCHGAVAGEDAAGEQRGAVEGKVVGDRHDLRLVHHDPLGERRGMKPVQNRLAVERGQRARRVAGEARLAQRGLLVAAEEAGSACTHEGDERPLSRCHPVHVRHPLRRRRPRPRARRPPASHRATRR